jgi:RNA polymerase sigma-70 factor (ECF subfamily)
MPERISDTDRAADAFPVTHWSLVRRVRGADPTAKREALSELISRYRPALRSHLVLRQRMDPDKADDLLQSFLCDKVVEQNFVERAEQQRGKFRTFLLTALQNFTKSDYRKASARKRSPGNLSPINEELDISDDGALPDEGFDVEWARSLLANAMARMKAECHKAGRQDLWTVFETRLVAPMMQDAEPMAYEQLVKACGFESPAQAANALVTAKRMFERILRATVGEYAKDTEAIDEEIQDLRVILSRARA